MAGKRQRFTHFKAVLQYLANMGKPFSYSTKERISLLFSLKSFIFRQENFDSHCALPKIRMIIKNFSQMLVNPNSSLKGLFKVWSWDGFFCTKYRLPQQNCASWNNLSAVFVRICIYSFARRKNISSFLPGLLEAADHSVFVQYFSKCIILSLDIIMWQKLLETVLEMILKQIRDCLKH